jgi:aminopeptidase N
MFQKARTLSQSLLILLVFIIAVEFGGVDRHKLQFNGAAFGATLQGEAKTAERQYAPDRKADILHITIDVTPDFKTRTVAGTTTIKFKPIAKPLTELRLDAIDLDVSSVTSSAQIEGYSVTDEAITITFDPPIEPGVEATVKVLLPHT